MVIILGGFMMYKKFTFIFAYPITCYGEVITEDTIFSSDLRKAMVILKKEHHYARVKETIVQDVELYKNGGRAVAIKTVNARGD